MIKPVPFLKRVGMVTFIRVLNCFLVFLIILALFPLDFRVYSSWAIFLLLPGIYTTLKWTSWSFTHFKKENLNTIIYMELVFSCLFIILLISVASSIQYSKFLILLLLLVLLLLLIKFKHNISNVVLNREADINNEFFFQEKLKKIIKRANNNKVSLVLVEISRYNQFKEQWGEFASSILLKNFSSALLNAVSKNEEYTLHYEEGKFAVIINGKDLSFLISRAEKIRKKLVQELGKALEDEWKLPVAVGISIFPEHGSSSDNLVQNAESALNRAVAAGGRRLQVYYPILNRVDVKKNTRLMEIMKNLVDLIYKDSKLIYQHSERVFMYSQIICRKLPLTRHQAALIGCAALLHDIGKIRFSSELEGEDQHSHPVYGAEILKRANQYGSIISSVIYHHEKYNGSGFPFGITRTKIPLGARVIAAANYFDHITAEIPYGKGESMEEGIQCLKSFKGTVFDPGIIEAFVTSLGQYNNLSQVVEWPKDISKIVPSGYTTNNYVLGGHYVQYYSGELHFITKAVQCINAGVSNNEKCLYVMGERKENLLMLELNKRAFTRKLRSDNNVLSAQLESLNFEHLLSISRDSSRVEFEIKKILKEWVDKAEKENYDYVRLIIDQSFFNFEGHGLRIWENVLTRCIKNLEGIVVCYYDFDLTSRQDIRLLETMHDKLLVTTSNILGEEKNAR